MSLVGTRVEWRDSPPPRSAPTDTGVWFATGLAERGQAGATRVTSMSQFVELLGTRQTYSILYGAAETFFREGGATLHVSRVTGPNPVTAGVNLNNGSALATLRASASSPGEWGNALNVQVIAGGVGGAFALVISHDTLGELERSLDLADVAAAISWASTSGWIRVSDLASTGNPASGGVQSLAGGTDDRTNAVEASWTAALAAFTRDLGPGQVSAPGRTTTAAHAALLAHAAASNRIALLDAPDVSNVATLVAVAAAQRSGGYARYGALFAPWAIVPGLLPGTTRVVPYSAIQAGLIARSDAMFTANVPAAGRNGQATFASALNGEWVDADRDALNSAGVNIGRVIYGGVRTYGYRTLVDPVSTPKWLQLGNARLAMQVSARGEAVLESYVLSEIDGRRHKLSQLHGELVGMLMPLWEVGSLYGDTPEDAFAVEVGPAVNTPVSLQAGELRALVALRMSPHAERVVLELAKTPITEAL